MMLNVCESFDYVWILKFLGNSLTAISDALLLELGILLLE